MPATPSGGLRPRLSRPRNSKFEQSARRRDIRIASVLSDQRQAVKDRQPQFHRHRRQTRQNLLPELHENRGHQPCLGDRDADIDGRVCPMEIGEGGGDRQASKAISVT